MILYVSFWEKNALAASFPAVFECSRVLSAQQSQFSHTQWKDQHTAQRASGSDQSFLCSSMQTCETFRDSRPARSAAAQSEVT